MTTIAITGVGGSIGRRVVAALDRHDGIDRILGLDRKPPSDVASSKLRFQPADPRDPGVGDTFRDVDVLLHLAFLTGSVHDEPTMHAVNVDGTKAIFGAARDAGVRRTVYLSSANVYGAYPDNDIPLTEDSELRGNPGLAEADHHRQVEAWLWPWAESDPELEVSVLRSALALGPGVDNAMTRMLESPRIAIVRGHRPPLQFIHVDDLVRAIVHVIDERLTGAYNVAAEGWLSFDEVTAIAARRTVELPEEVAFTTTGGLWRLGLGAQPPAMLPYLMYPCVMSSARLLATGWQPLHPNRDALATTVSEHARYVSLGRTRLERAWIRRVAAAMGGAAIAVAAGRIRRRRRHRR